MLSVTRFIELVAHVAAAFPARLSSYDRAGEQGAQRTTLFAAAALRKDLFRIISSYCCFVVTFFEA